MVARTATSPPPPAPAIPLALEDTLLTLVLAGDLDSCAIAKAHDLPLTVFLDWLGSPLTRSRIAAALEAEESALHRRHLAAKKKAIAELETAIATSKDPVERRRAATSLMRPIHRRTPLPSLRPLAVESTRRRILGPPPEPDSSLDSCDAVRICLERLADNDNPAPESGLSTLHNFMTYKGPVERNRTKPASELLAEAGERLRLVNCSGIVIRTEEYNVSREHFPRYSAVERAHLNDRDGNRLVADFHLELVCLGAGSAWRIKRIEYIDEEADNKPETDEADDLADETDPDEDTDPDDDSDDGPPSTSALSPDSS